MLLRQRIAVPRQGDLEEQHTSASKATTATDNDDVTREAALWNMLRRAPGQAPGNTKDKTLEQPLGVFEEWPGLRGYCQYLEGCFQPLLEDKYACVWMAIEVRRPLRPVECWPLFNALNEAIQPMGENTTIAKILDAMKHSKSDPVDVDKTICLIATFSVLCWSSMTLQPMLLVPEQSAPGLSARRDSHAEQFSLKLDTVHRPIVAAFRSSLRNHSSGPWRHPIRDTSLEQSSVLHVSTLEFQSLQDMGKIRIRWVDDLSSHLDFDSRKRNLAVFRFPSFCALTVAVEKRSTVFEGFVAESRHEPS